MNHKRLAGAKGRDLQPGAIACFKAVIIGSRHETAAAQAQIPHNAGVIFC